MLDDCWRYLYTIWRSSVAITADRDLEIDPRMLKVFPYVEDLSMPVLPMHVEGLPAHVEDLSTRGRSRGLAMA